LARNLRIHRPDETVLEDHGRNLEARRGRARRIRAEV
jgi:hypothetical protein